MSDLEWYFPRSLRQVPALLARPGVIAHGGGTAILRGGLSQIRGLVDLSRLGLDHVEIGPRIVRLGAMCTYRRAAAALAAAQPQHPLARALSVSASTPLRNRITLGGSIAVFPYWSDLVGPLLALDARLKLLGLGGGSGKPGPAGSSSVSLLEYLGRRELREGSLIREVLWREQDWRGAHYRFTRVSVDRPAFTLSLLLRASPRSIRDVRLIVVGCTGRFRRLQEAEEALRGRSPRRAPVAEAVRATAFSFPSRMGYSGEYLERCARVELERLLAAELEAAR